MNNLALVDVTEDDLLEEINATIRELRERIMAQNVLMESYKTYIKDMEKKYAS